MRRAVFLDRDNTLIANDGDLGDPGAVVLLPGVTAGLALLHDAGFALVVVTNQGGVARGRFGEDAVHAVHTRLAELVDAALERHGVLDAFYYCPFHPDAVVPAYRREHPWRKPSPGMLEEASRDLGIALEESWLIGDAARDVEAGRRAGCRTILLGPSANGSTMALPPDFTASDLAAAARIVLDQHVRRDDTSRTARSRP